MRESVYIQYDIGNLSSSIDINALIIYQVHRQYAFIEMTSSFFDDEREVFGFVF